MSALREADIATLKRVGWFEGRSVPVDQHVPKQHPAFRALSEFGGLQIVRDGIVDLDFQFIEEGKDQITPWAAALQSEVVGIALAYNSHGALYVTQAGQVIGCSLVHAACWFEGKTIYAAVANVLAGRRNRPMLLQHQSEVTLYGEVFRHGDRQVVTPDSPELRKL